MNNAPGSWPAMRPMRHFSSLLWGLGEESQLTHLRVDEDRALLHLEYPLDFRYADLQTLHLSILLWGLDLDQARSFVSCGTDWASLL